MRRYLRETLLLIIAVGMLFLSLYWLVPNPAPRPRSLRMTAGDASGLRHKLALELAKEARRVGIEVEVQPTSGSEAAMAGLMSGEFDLAFVQGGLSTELAQGIFQATAMHIEPLHLLVSADLFQRCQSGGLKALNGCRVNLGSAESGTHMLASAVLTFAGLAEKSPHNPDGFEASTFGYSDLLQLPRSEVPDAIFTVSSLPSPVADQLVEEHGYRLMPLPFAEALTLQALSELGAPRKSGAIDKRHIFEARIPAYTYSVNPAEPPAQLATIGTRLLLLANREVPEDVIASLLDVLYGSDFSRAERPPLDPSLLDLPSEFPLHPGAESYRARNKPLIAGDAIDYWEKVIAITATLVGGTFFIAQWYLSWSRRRREASFASYMERVLSIEHASMQTELSAELDLAELIKLQRDLAEIKSDAMRKFSAGQLEGEGMIHGFLALANDARNQLTRLILHQRENIEQQAMQQHVEANQIWSEQSRSGHP